MDWMRDWGLCIRESDLCTYGNDDDDDDDGVMVI